MLHKIKLLLFQKPKIWKYRLLSDCSQVFGKYIGLYAVVCNGKGVISFGKKVHLGYEYSPGFFNSYGYLEARNPDSEIVIGNNTMINNGFSFVATQKIELQENVVIGVNCHIYDSDFHHLNPSERHHPNPPSSPVTIEKNVFIGSNVTILKGVVIGENTVIGNNSVVTKSIPSNVVAAGNPARIVRDL